ncbi:MAG: GtrA family protein [Jatrophihabitans sp.]|uniref:GtrA family protein n=1 Tax=Jatrophihabitans sp. TaxID=1932789 RepID=UPI003F801A0D
MTMVSSSSLRDHLRSSWRVLAKEIAAFGVVGALSFVIDFGLFTWLAPHGALKANFISTIVSTAFAYFGNRHWSFSHRARTSIGRETSFFFGINLIALGFSEAMIALFVYGLDYGHDSGVVLLVKLVSIGIGTLFRFWAYKRFVFLHPDKVRADDADLDVELAE